MTDNAIIKALECFAIDKDFDETHCIGCAFEHQFCTANMSVDIAIPALDLINRQKAEIERLQDVNIRLTKAEAIKEFAERLKEQIHIKKDKAFYSAKIDNLVKEMVGEDG